MSDCGASGAVVAGEPADGAGGHATWCWRRTAHHSSGERLLKFSVERTRQVGVRCGEFGILLLEVGDTALELGVRLCECIHPVGLLGEHGGEVTGGEAGHGRRKVNWR